MKILAIGNKSMTERLIMALAGSEFELLVTRELCQAITPLEQEEFDLIVIDSLANGVKAACQYIRTFGDVPIVLMMSQREPDWEEIQSADLDGYIQRWVNGAELIACLRAMVRRFWPAQSDQATRHYLAPMVLNVKLRKSIGN